MRLLIHLIYVLAGIGLFVEQSQGQFLMEKRILLSRASEQIAATTIRLTEATVINSGKELIVTTTLRNDSDKELSVDITDITIRKFSLPQFKPSRLSPQALPVTVGIGAQNTKGRFIAPRWASADFKVGETYTLTVTGTSDNGNFSASVDFTMTPVSVFKKPEDAPPIQLDARIDVRIDRGIYYYTIVNNDSVSIDAFNLQTHTPAETVGKPPEGWSVASDEKAVWWGTDKGSIHAVPPKGRLGEFVIRPKNATTETVGAPYAVVSLDGKKVRIDSTHGPRPTRGARP
jgi:hypothetical protein